MSFTKPVWLTPVLLIVVSTLAAIVMVLSRPESATVAMPDRTVVVDVAEVVKQDLRIPIQAQGTVTPYRETAIVAEVAGKVIEISDAFYAGGYVAKGDLLIRIDDVLHQANVNRAEAAVATAESELAQEQGRADVAEQEYRSFPRTHRSDAARQLYLRQPQLKQAQAQLLAAQADLRKARHDLELTVIRAPYDCLVKEKQSDLGLYLSPGTPIAKVFAIDFAEVRLAIPQSKLAYLDLPGINRVGDSKVNVDLYTSINGQLDHWSASLHRTEGVYDERSRVLFVVARIDDPYLLKPLEQGVEKVSPLRMGTFVSAMIAGRLMKDLVVLPRNILRAGDFVWVVDEQDTLRNRKVTAMRTQGKEIYITSGLQNGDRVCVTPLGSVVAGSKVEIASSKSTAELFPQQHEPEMLRDSPAVEETLELSGSTGSRQGDTL